MNAPARHAALPPTLAPRGLSRVEAAAYIGVPIEVFDRMVRRQQIPNPERGRGWDKGALDSALDAISSAWQLAAQRKLRPDRPWASYDGVPGVYLIGFRDYVKIGVSSSIGSRLRELSQYLPEPICLLKLLRDKSLKYERALHRRFSADRLNGEWFRLSHSLQEFIDGDPE